MMSKIYKIPSSSSKGFRILRRIVHVCFIRVLVILFSGVLVSGRDNAPGSGPAILAVNHNSHADTVLLQSLYPVKYCVNVRPAGAADYFFSNRFISWISSNCLGVVPVVRSRENPDDNPLEYVNKVLNDGDIVIIFPEGTRSTTGEIGKIKGGIVHLHNNYPDVPIIPIHMDGTSRLLPKGSFLPTPFLVKVNVGQAINTSKDIISELDRFFRSHDETPADDLYY